MTKTQKRLAAVVVTASIVAGGVSTLAQEPGPIGQGLNEAGRAMKRGFQTAGQAVQGSFQKTRTAVHNMEVVSRVYSRIHWDKTLTGSTLEIEVKAGGIAFLTGIVPDDAAKAKAITLTAETVGVVQVVDQLTVAAPTPTTAAPVVPGRIVPSPTPANTIPPPIQVTPENPLDKPLR